MTPPTPRVWVDRIKFSDNSEIGLGADDVVVIVGPNNSGKSAALRAIRDKATNPGTPSPVVALVTLLSSGSASDVMHWLQTTTKRIDQPPANPAFHALGATVHTSQVPVWWKEVPAGLQGLARFFVHLLTAEARLQAADPAPNIAIARDPLTHPIHYLYRDDEIETRLSGMFRKAFGADLVVHRSAGSLIPLHTGDRPKPAAGQDRISYEYVKKIEELTPLQNQGDGMRSFAGILLNTSVGRESVLLIDEPEAFLHPPQARFLGRLLVAEKPIGRQVFVATHSGDVLRGILDANQSNVRVVRIQREGSVNPTRELDNEKIAALWNDPLLRYSNILDGLFHERVVLAESDSDSRFYAAVADSLTESKEGETRPPDTMFTHCGGKQRLPMVVRALRELGVPVVVITDFDILDAEPLIRSIVEAAGGDWPALSDDWKLVKTAIDAKKPELTTEDVIAKVEAVFAKAKERVFPDEARQEIQAILRKSSPWSIAKGVGKAYVPSGDPTKACDRLFKSLQSMGVFVVPVGELEGFARSIGSHGPKWVNAVLQKDLKADPELSEARKFVRSFAL